MVNAMHVRIFRLRNSYSLPQSSHLLAVGIRAQVHFAPLVEQRLSYPTKLSPSSCGSTRTGTHRPLLPQPRRTVVEGERYTCAGEPRRELCPRLWSQISPVRLSPPASPKRSTVASHGSRFLLCCTYVKTRICRLTKQPLSVALGCRSTVNTGHSTRHGSAQVHYVCIAEVRNTCTEEAVPHSSSRFGLLWPQVPAALEVEFKRRALRLALG